MFRRLVWAWEIQFLLVAHYVTNWLWLLSFVSIENSIAMKWVGGNSIFCCHRDILNDHLKPMDAHLRVTTKRQLGFTSRTDISGSNLESAFFLTTILEDNKVMWGMNVCVVFEVTSGGYRDFKIKIFPYTAPYGTIGIIGHHSILFGIISIGYLSRVWSLNLKFELIWIWILSFLQYDGVCRLSSSFVKVWPSNSWVTLLGPFDIDKLCFLILLTRILQL